MMMGDGKFERLDSDPQLLATLPLLLHLSSVRSGIKIKKVYYERARVTCFVGKKNIFSSQNIFG